MSVSRPSRLLLIAAVAACAWVGGLVVSHATALALPATQSILVVHDSGKNDTLWLYAPDGSSATSVGTLPGHAGQVAVAPDGKNVAYMPASGNARVWIRYGALGPRTINLHKKGLKWVHSFTWISNEKLLVSGTKKGSAPDPYNDHLYVVNAATGKVASFRHLRGTEPSAAVEAGKVAYTAMRTLSPAIPRKGLGPKIQESLKLLSLNGKHGGKTVDSARYRVVTDQREFSDPRLSPDADWLLYAQSGDDAYVRYTVRDTGKLDEPRLDVSLVTIWTEAGWDPSGARAAFTGKLWTPSGYQACVWVYDTDTGVLTRTPRDLLPETVIASMTWSDDGRLVTEADDFGEGVQRLLVMPGDDLSSITDIGEGGLPVWVQP
jgi:WD40 repeat protein